ncbi:MAG: LamG domain-containing protein [Planctomycetota bacterium]
MSNKSILIGAFGLLWFFGASLQAQPLARYTFDDGTPRDNSGSGLDGVLLGDAAIVSDPGRGQILQINQSGMQADGPFDITTSFTLSAWVKLDLPRTGRYYFGGPWWIRTDNQEGSEHHWCEIRYPGGSFVDKFDTRSGNNPDGQLDGQWHYIAVVLPEDGAVKAYVDGALAPVRDNNTKAHDFESAVGPLFFGTEDENGGNAISGYMDDIQVFNYAVSEDEIPAIMEGGSLEYPFALSPEPADGALHKDTWVNLSWSPGRLAASHDVYLGDNFDDVDNGAEGTFVGNQTDTFIVVGFPGFAFPEGLVPGMTYYWRIDEVNDAEPNSPWKGDVWSFSIPPKTAYLPEPTDGAESIDLNSDLSWTGGFGAKVHTVYFGDNFDDVNNAAGGLPHGTATYDPGPLELAKTYYWRVDEFDGFETYKGNVWSFITQGAVGSPDPAKGAVDVSQTPTLTWTPGLGASHEVYFGADAASLELKGSGNLGSESFEPGQLEWNSTYYWRVDEVNNANADSPWTGPLWSFTTANFLIIDDMEAYNDIEEGEEGSNRIYLAWADGYDNPAINGSVVGNDPPPIAELTIVHGGLQSMPMAYDNAVGKSEATLTLTSNRNWTVNGVTTLTIWFRGNAGNTAEQMYVTLNGNARVDHDNPDATLATAWTEWNIDLQAFADQGVNLSNVSSITLGLSSGSGGTGKMYYDDIRLYAPVP